MESRRRRLRWETTFTPHVSLGKKKKKNAYLSFDFKIKKSNGGNQLSYDGMVYTRLDKKNMRFFFLSLPSFSLVQAFSFGLRPPLLLRHHLSHPSFSLVNPKDIGIM